MVKAIKAIKLYNSCKNSLGGYICTLWSPSSFIFTRQFPAFSWVLSVWLAVRVVTDCLSCTRYK